MTDSIAATDDVAKEELFTFLMRKQSCKGVRSSAAQWGPAVRTVSKWTTEKSKTSIKKRGISGSHLKQRHLSGPLMSNPTVKACF